MALPQEKIYTIEDIYSLPEGQRAELIDGRIYDMAPPSTGHQRILMNLAGDIRNYIKNHKGTCEVFPAPFAVFPNNDELNYVEPDISVICDKRKLDDRGYHGAPDWIIEIISPSTQSRDYLKKLWLYQNTGVREYWIVNPKTSSTTVYNFENGESYSSSFDEWIPVGIFHNLNVRISDLL